MKKEIKDTLFQPVSPFRLFLSLLTVVFGMEMLIMFVILPKLFGSAEGTVPSIVDAFLLLLLSAPFIWMLIVRPLSSAALDVSLGFFLILYMANLNSLIDHFLHPEIPYFDIEHIVVGGSTAFVAAVLVIMLTGYIRKLKASAGRLIDAQEELVRKEKLAALGQLAGSVGHELRTPLGVMNNALYFLSTVTPDAGNTVKEYLKIIKKEVDNSERIIADLLDFSRPRIPQMKPATVSELINQSFDKCPIPEGITVDTDIPATLPPVTVDPFQMGQVFQNLITNAVQAMPEGGTVRISARVTRDEGLTRDEGRGTKDEGRKDFSSIVQANGHPSSIEISVSDTGEGISPDNMKKLFQPLFTTKPKGIGLGLTVCRRLTEANGGRIEVQSEGGKGTTFTVMLPA